MQIAVCILHRNGKGSLSFHKNTRFSALKLGTMNMASAPLISTSWFPCRRSWISRKGARISQQAPGILRQFRVFVQVDKKVLLIISRGDRVRDFISDPPAPGIHGGGRERECILSDILETDVPERYFLSQTQMERLLSKSYRDQRGTFSSSRNAGLLLAARRAISKNRVPLASSANPRRFPAIEKLWQGKPPQIRSISGNAAGSMVLASPGRVPGLLPRRSRHHPDKHSGWLWRAQRAL